MIVYFYYKYYYKYLCSHLRQRSAVADFPFKVKDKVKRNYFYILSIMIVQNHHNALILIVAAFTYFPSFVSILLQIWLTLKYFSIIYIFY